MCVIRSLEDDRWCKLDWFPFHDACQPIRNCSFGIHHTNSKSGLIICSTLIPSNSATHPINFTLLNKQTFGARTYFSHHVTDNDTLRFLAVRGYRPAVTSTVQDTLAGELGWYGFMYHLRVVYLVKPSTGFDDQRLLYSPVILSSLETVLVYGLDTY